MTGGVFFAVVGASGAGKDTVLAGARSCLSANPCFRFPQRYITRPENAGGENHISVSDTGFRRMKESGEFCLSWSAHQLHYGLSRDLVADLQVGQHMVCNVSRASLGDAASVFERMQVIEITAAPGIIAQRLRSRGRETAADVAARQARQVADWRNGHCVHTIHNDSVAQEAVTAMTGLLLRLSAQIGQ
ncbi:MAG: phosphonate metabolism protein/1,5-bisphosphokinase (PRPP-forming) PhnN [Pseudomonadota bacterium]